MALTTVEYISIGGNRNSAASDWSRRSNLVAFGADQNIAIWQPLSDLRQGIIALLHGHEDKVTAVQFSQGVGVGQEHIISGSADGHLRIWQFDRAVSRWRGSHSCQAHNGAVNAIAVVEASNFFATGGADAWVKLWRLADGTVSEQTSVHLQPHCIPLSLVLGTFTDETAFSSLFLAVGGTRSSIQVFALSQLDQTPRCELQATLSGHEGWVRSLALRPSAHGFLLASASHDKYIRIWRVQRGNPASVSTGTDQVDEASLDTKTLTGKVYTVTVPEARLSITFEALLLGHEDWIYSTAWNPSSASLQLLTASADGSLAIWEPDESSGIWISSSRLGEISGQKGATTATGSAGGFWAGLWSPDGQAVISLGRTGSWRIWRYDAALRYWVQSNGVSGHIAAANGVSWSTRNNYLLSTSSDQTTRLHAEWKRDAHRTWHEFSRPQIHGYDLNCIVSVSPQRFVSGADEKLLRVFDEPKTVAGILQRLCRIKSPDASTLPDAANVAVLGLSNKATDANREGGQDADGDEATAIDAIDTSSIGGDEPPTEDLLARHSLWPEHEKLYGHGYEISEVATNLEGCLVATACKASSIDHAVIRLYDTKDWNEIKPPLTAHSLTVTRLAFSCFPDPFLLSVGRDRQWTVFAYDQDDPKKWSLFQSFPKAHSRMILDAAFSPCGGQPFFATAGRDKTIKLWHLDQYKEGGRFQCHTTLTRPTAVTALAFDGCWDEDLACLTAGEEDGSISLHVFNYDNNLKLLKSFELDKDDCPSKAVTRLSWRGGLWWSKDVDEVTNGKGTGDDVMENEDVDGKCADNEFQHLSNHLAVASIDGSVRILRVAWERECRADMEMMDEECAAVRARCSASEEVTEMMSPHE